MKAGIAVSALCAATVVGTAASMNTSLVRSAEARTRVLWSDREAYIIIGVQNVGWSGSYLGRVLLLIREVVSPWGAAYRALRPDLVLWHLDGGRLTRHYLPGVSSSSTFMPVNGVLYRGMGSVEGAPRTWRWEGTKFEPITYDEDREIRALGTQDTLLKQSGWEEASLSPFEGAERVFPLKVNGQDFVLRLEKQGANSGEGKRAAGWLRISLRGTSTPEIVLHEFDPSWQRVDRAQYLELSKSPEGPDGERMRAER